MKYQTVKQLTELNLKLHKSAEAFIKLTDKAKVDIQAVKDEVNDRYFGSDSNFSELPKQTRQQLASAEIRKRTTKISQQFDTDSKGQLRDIGGLTEAINDAQDLYQPVRRLNLETSSGDAAVSRAAIQQMMDGISVPEVQTLLAKFEATNDHPGLAALSAVAGRNADIRKQVSPARIVRNVKFGDEDQISAIFHAGNNMTQVLLDESRSVNNAANSGTRRISSGLRGMKVEDGKVVDTREAVGGDE